MKYRFKIDTPWGKAGTSVPPIITDSDVPRNSFGYLLDCSKFPGVFEPIPEVSPEEKVAKWLRDECPYHWHDSWNEPMWSLNLSIKLIAAGLDPDKLK